MLSLKSDVRKLQRKAATLGDQNFINSSEKRTPAWQEWPLLSFHIMTFFAKIVKNSLTASVYQQRYHRDFPLDLFKLHHLHVAVMNFWNIWTNTSHYRIHRVHLWKNCWQSAEQPTACSPSDNKILMKVLQCTKMKNMKNQSPWCLRKNL